MKLLLCEKFIEQDRKSGQDGVGRLAEDHFRTHNH